MVWHCGTWWSRHPNNFNFKKVFLTVFLAARLQFSAEVEGQMVAISDALLSFPPSPDNSTSVQIECKGSGTLTWTCSSGAAIPLIRSSSNPVDNVFQRSDSTSNKQTLFIQSFVAANRGVYTCSTHLGRMEITEAVFVTSCKSPACSLQS